MLDDKETESYIYIISSKDVLVANLCKDINILSKLDNINWRPVHTESGRLARSAAWYTSGNCSCEYRYGGHHTFKANEFTPWMTDLATGISKLLNIEQVPNSCNFDRYIGGHQSVSYHADDESLFCTDDGNVTIVSLSWGATRTFGFKKQFQLPKEAETVSLAHGEVLVMGGKTQLHWQHAILPSPPTIGSPSIRYNATFRYVVKHSRKCNCRASSH